MKKIITFLSSGLLAGALTLSADQIPLPGMLDSDDVFSEDEILEALGYLAGEQLGLGSFEFNEAEAEQLLKGLRTAILQEDLPYDLDEMNMALQVFMQTRQQEAMARAEEASNEQYREFFAELDEEEGVVVLESGLRYRITEEGDGPNPTEQNTVRIHYEGTLINGEVFDSSHQRGEPTEFPLAGVIDGFREGLQQLPVGSEATLYVPPHLGYGFQDIPGIPAGSLLIFDVELLEIVD
ncbi:MAG: FKBP-type peptidyl-prolyl cis-trans isomerase [Opitutales bacterium]|nr:FKBP-type peptidyl-prolyl cis-trans isomerase [Opitutales bacterium]MCH8539547.1 FKBP-type peptidyl-prolyl cis-trans isomerase [Opitutales bacterium]